MSDKMTDAEKQEPAVEMSQDLTQPTIEAVVQLNDELKKKLEAAEGRLASPELKSELVNFKSEVQKFSEGLCGTIDKLLARIEDPKSGVVCGDSLQKLIQKLNFSYVNPSITEANFPDVGVKTDFTVYDFKKNVSSEFAIEQMAKKGDRPANLRELLTYLEKQWNGKDWMVALGGPVWRDSDGDRGVPYAWGGGGWRGLNLYYFGGGWFSNYRFLAVRNS